MQFIYAISPMQSKVARTYLNWTQQDLAIAAEVGRSTVRSYEDGFSPRRDSVVKIRRTYEKHGIEFSDNDGVKRITKEVTIHRNIKTYDLYSDFLQITKKQGSDTQCTVESQDLFMCAYGLWLILNASNCMKK